jgi:hypothetical protein
VEVQLLRQISPTRLAQPTRRKLEAHNPTLSPASSPAQIPLAKCRKPQILVQDHRILLLQQIHSAIYSEEVKAVKIRSQIWLET